MLAAMPTMAVMSAKHLLNKSLDYLPIIIGVCIELAKEFVGKEANITWVE